MIAAALLFAVQGTVSAQGGKVGAVVKGSRAVTKPIKVNPNTGLGMDLGTIHGAIGYWTSPSYMHFNPTVPYVLDSNSVARHGCRPDGLQTVTPNILFPTSHATRGATPAGGLDILTSPNIYPYGAYKNPGMEVLESTNHGQVGRFDLNSGLRNEAYLPGGDKYYANRFYVVYRELFTKDSLTDMDLERLSNRRETLANIVVGSRFYNLETKGNAMLQFAVISDAQATIELVKQFLNREYGGVNKMADSYAIMTCIMLGEEGEGYLRELAEQRDGMRLKVSAGWAFAKEKVAGLKLSYDLIGSYEKERIDAQEMKKWILDREIVQSKLNQTK